MKASPRLWDNEAARSGVSQLAHIEVLGEICALECTIPHPADPRKPS